MNPRKFCWGDPYDVFLGTTYNFDPGFFERVVLRDIQSACTNAIIIAADQNYLVKNAAKWQDRVSKLGREYVLAPAGIHCLFHPKVMAKLSHDKAHLWIGSNNLTYAGWYGNSELASTLTADRRSMPESGVINLLKSLKVYIPNARVGEIITSFLEEYPADGNPVHLSRIIMTPPEDNLASILSRRWTGRRFKKLRIFTGSTDDKGAFIEWCAKQFGVEEVILAANPDNIALTLPNVRKLPVELSIAPIEARDERLHAKCYFFENKGELAVITGSANCSRAAWLIPPSSGGNVECITIFDEVSKESFPILEDFPKNAVPALTFLKTHQSPALENRLDANRVRVIAVRLSRLNASLEVEVEGHCEELSGVTVKYDHSDIQLGPKDVTKTLWYREGVITLSESLSSFCEVFLFSGRLARERIVWWIEDVEELNHSMGQRRLTEAFLNLGSAQTPRDLRRALNELYEIQDIIFELTEEAPDKHHGTLPASSPSEERTVEAENAVPISPDMLIRSLSEAHSKASAGRFWPSGGFLSLLSLSGILRSIFVEEADTTDYDDEQPSTKRSSNSDLREMTVRLSEAKDQETNEWKSKLNTKLSGVLNDFFKRFIAEEFARSSTVYQFQQATAYPLALIVVGTRGRWLDRQKAFQWIVKLVDILFNREYGDHNGLLRSIHKRYSDAGKLNSFSSIVGDGTLWILSLLAIASTKADDLRSSIMKGVLLRTVFQERTLIEKADAQKLSSLRGAAAFDKTVAWLLENGGRLLLTIEELEAFLKRNKELFVAKQRSWFDEGELVFHPYLGWGWYEGLDENRHVQLYFQARAESRSFADTTYFIVLEDAMKASKEVKQAIRKMRNLTRNIVSFR